MKSDVILKNLVRVGTVDSVNVQEGTARVRFEDKDNLISGELKVLQNQPLIVIEKETNKVKWDREAGYATVDRGIESINYTKKLPDEIELTYNLEKHKVTVHPWLPYIGQMVLCVYLPMDNGDGFVIGGI